MGNTNDQSNDPFPRFPRPFVPVYARNTRREQPEMLRSSLREHCKAWFNYHSIQLRWDIERTLARWLHRPWRG